MTGFPLHISGMVLAAALALGAPARAYTYAPIETEPLLDGREAMFQAAETGFWMAVQMTMESMRPEIEYLDENEDPGITDAFDEAIADRDAEALRAAFIRAAADEINRRLSAARDNIEEYQTAKLLVVAANSFYTAVAADLGPETSAVLAEQLPLALDAIGNPGALGVGRTDPDPAALDAARAAIAEALASPAL